MFLLKRYIIYKKILRLCIQLVQKSCEKNQWAKCQESQIKHTRLHARQTIVMENPMVKPNFSFFANLI